jgi:glutamine---fructose-6-phosphate transaminase (isomerizing)
MCGIVGAITRRNVTPILIEGLKRLEYRGYDSAGLAVLDWGELRRVRRVGKVDCLRAALDEGPIKGRLGIAHTRWATHGVPSERNAHPHVSSDGIAVVHNGIIENHEILRNEMEAEGVKFSSDTDTEVVVHLIQQSMKTNVSLLQAVRDSVARIDGAYALAVMSVKEPDSLVIARLGCPVVIGLGINENFVASDIMALLPITRRFIFLEEGDVAHVSQSDIFIYDAKGNQANRSVTESRISMDAAELGGFQHFMKKEIHEQPRSIADTLCQRSRGSEMFEGFLGADADSILSSVRAVHIVACGTSYHAGLIARHQIEEIARIPCVVEVASEYRYRRPVVPDDTLFVAVSQSGETADTLAATKLANELGYLATLAICNVPESSLIRESDIALMTRAGPEIGVASTKAFTTQLTAFALLGLSIAERNGADPRELRRMMQEIEELPGLVERTLELDRDLAKLAERFLERQHTLFLGRGVMHPVAMEGALKLKEISYIHAEAYPAGELKHGPLALVDENMPVVAVAPNDSLIDKLKSNLQEVSARGGELFIFADPGTEIQTNSRVHVMHLSTRATPLQAPIIFSVPLQLLSYHVALLKGTDVDKPRNLAKSVTVE